MKRFYNTKYKIIGVISHILCLACIGVILVSMIGNCVYATKDMMGQIYINPFDDQKAYNQSEEFSYEFLNDTTSLMYYLAISKQFETDGEFDTDKTIDLLEYYYRKYPKSESYSTNGELVYRVQDLISWKESYGFTVYENNSLMEAFYPVDGSSVYTRDLEYILNLSILTHLQNTIGIMDIGIYEEPINEIIDEKKLAMPDAINQEATMNVEEITDDIGTSSLLQSELVEGVDESYILFNQIIKTVADDLAYNYRLYQEQKDFYSSKSGNFKYLYIPCMAKDGNINYFTNLSCKTMADAEYLVQYFNEKLAACVIIDTYSGNIEMKNIEIDSSKFLSVANRMKYAYTQGGKIYVGVLDQDVKGFSDYDTSDKYASIKDAYNSYNRNFYQVAIITIVLLLLSLGILIVLSFGIGRRNDEENQIYVLKVDYLYLEISIVIVGIILAGGIAGAIMAVKYSFDEFFPLIYTTLKNGVFASIVAAYIGILDLIFLGFYSSFVRRAKNGILFKQSILYKSMLQISRLLKFIQKGVFSIYNNANVVAKSVLLCVPVGLLMALHVMAGLNKAEFFMFFLFIIDVVIAFGIIYANMVRNRIIKGIDRISNGELSYKVSTDYMVGDNLRLANAVNCIGNGISEAVAQSMKDERMKADLITNVSHDIKTPLTSIINYVDLLKRENIQDDTLKAYIEVLDNKSQRLKQLTDDLVEASKISSGNIVLELEDINLVDLMKQALGEFSDKFEEKGLQVITNYDTTPCIINADSRRMWRVVDNLLNNVYKYAMEQTRVYIGVNITNERKFIYMKNISSQPLNIEAEELTQRFIRGDVSRSTEGSGLGLSIAKNLVEAQNGKFEIYLDGDLFKVTIEF